MTGIIYSVTNKSNCKTYVGQTTQTLQIRKNCHFNDAHNKRDKMVFHKAIRKYDENNFIWNVIVEYGCKNAQELKNMLNGAEVYYIDAYDTFNNGYNLTKGGGGNVGHKHTEKSKQLQREAKLGKKATEETIQKMREAHLGKKATEETIQKMRESSPHISGESHPMWGKHHTEKTIQKMREAQKDKKHPMYGKHHTEKTIQKLSEAQKGEKNYWYGKSSWNKGMNKEEMKLYGANKEKQAR